MLILFLLCVTFITAICDPATEQLVNFKKKNTVAEILTTVSGCPIDMREADGLNSVLLNNKLFMDSLPSLVRERLPERIVHAKGAGAFGYFEVTHNITDLCKAKLFSEVGKKTPVFTRFSSTGRDKGEGDTLPDPRGIGIKFYTEEGNFDLANFHIPLFLAKDPNLFSSVVKIVKRNPVTNLRDPTMIWDYASLRPEALHFAMYLFGPNGIPDGYRNTPAFSIHTYQVVNENGESYFMRFHILPEKGLKSLPFKEAFKIAGENPDYGISDLYNAIGKGEYPVWTVNVQVLSLDDVKQAKFDPFDVTKILPLKQYPLRPVGKVVLNENPTNYFSQVEQVAFCPSNLVPGILGAPDKLFEARRFAYRDAQFYRLGANFDKIEVNCPFSKVFSYNRDGVPPVGENGGSSPNYYPNSYNGPVPYVEDMSNPELISVKHDYSDGLDQVIELYDEMTDEEKNMLIENVAGSLVNVPDVEVKQRMVKMFAKVNSDLGRIISELVMN